MPALTDRLDGYQRRHRWLGFPVAVVYKFFDDQSSYLAAIITYYAFAAIFPLLLISSSVLGWIVRGNEEFKDQLLNSALSQFPIVGTQLGSSQGLQGSVLGVTAGALTALYGILGLGQAAQNAIFVGWGIPRNSRPNPLLSRVHSGLLLMLSGFAVLLVAALSTAATSVNWFGVNLSQQFGYLVNVVSILVTALVLALLTRVATPERERLLRLLPGSLVTAVLWQLLQQLGGVYVAKVVQRASDLNGLFAVTLGLLALIYMAANMAVFGMQVNVVLVHKLWPRALLTPFTDSVELTEADRRAYTQYAQAQRHKGFERVDVEFDPPPTGENRALDSEPSSANQKSSTTELDWDESERRAAGASTPVLPTADRRR